MLSSCVSWAGTRFLHLLSPESAHNFAIKFLSLGLYPGARPDSSRLATQCLGLNFSNPIGLAAGFDKDCRAAAALSRTGFGFVECGTVTLRAQPGNPLPRLFRLSEDGAIINRMGFNSCGAPSFSRRLKRLRQHENPRRQKRIIGVNLGINKEERHPRSAYAALVTCLGDEASYITINLSSPNTPGLRQLQHADSVIKILSAISAQSPEHPPILVKLAPDLPEDALPDVVEACIDGGASGLIVSNTTISRPYGLTSVYRSETGGLSGRPLSQLAIGQLKAVHRLSKGRLTLISAGGIETGFDVMERIQAGADLVQLYSAFVLKGPAIIQRIKHDLLQEMTKRNYHSIADVIADRPA